MKTLKGIVRAIVSFSIFMMSSLSAFSQEGCEDEPQNVSSVCSGQKVDFALDEAENQFPRNYENVLEVFKDCAEAVGNCYQRCNNKTVGVGESLSSQVSKLRNQIGKPPLNPSIYGCRTTLKRFSDDIDLSCRGRNLKAKGVLEKKALHLSDLLSVCENMGQMKSVEYSGPVTSQTVQNASGNFKPLPGGVAPEKPLQSTSKSELGMSGRFEPLGEGEPKEPVGSESRSGFNEEHQNRFSGQAKNLGGTGYGKSRPKNNNEFKSSLGGPRDFPPGSYGKRKSIKKIPMHGRTRVQQREGNKLNLGFSVPEKENWKDLKLKKSPPESSIWEVHSEAFQK